MNTDVPALTGLRAIAASWVLSHHLMHALRPVGSEIYSLSTYFGAAGFLGVDIFFVLSGFILAHNYANSGLGETFRAYAGFLWKRLARIYPVHIAALALFCVFLLLVMAFDLRYSAWHRQTWSNLLQQLTLTHAWALPIPKSWNVVSWSVSAEWAAYLCFPVVAVLAHRFRSIAAAGAMILLLFFALGWNIHFGYYSGTMAYGLVRIAFEFPAGVLLHRMWTLTGCQTSSRFDAFAIVAAVVLLVGGNAMANTWGADTTLAIMPIVAAALVYCLAGSTTVAKRILASTVMNHLGRVSYSLYMVHLVPLGLLAAVAQKYALYPRTLLMSGLFLVAVIAAYVCAVGFYRFIEEPARRWLVERSPFQASRQLQRNVMEEKSAA